jgi:hypothetical protein
MIDYSNGHDATAVNVRITRLETLSEVSDRQMERLGGKVETLTTTIDRQLPALTSEVGRLATAMSTFQADLKSQFESKVHLSAKMAVVWGILAAVGVAVIAGLGRILFARIGG